MADPSDTRPTAAVGVLNSQFPGDGPLVILGDGTMTRAWPHGFTERSQGEEGGERTWTIEGAS